MKFWHMMKIVKGNVLTGCGRWHAQKAASSKGKDEVTTGLIDFYYLNAINQFN